MAPPMHPPPYQSPQSQNSSTVIIDADEFSDDEGTEVAEDGDCEVVETSRVQVRTSHPRNVSHSHVFQFLPSHDVLQDHWRRNGPPRSTQLVRTPSVYPITVPVQAQNSAKRTPAPLTPRQPDPVQTTQAPVEKASPQQTSTQLAVSRSAARLAPSPTAPLTVPPVPQMTPLALVSPQINNPPQRSSYPPAWQDLIDHSCTYILHDMLFSHPFPSGVDGQKWAREAVSAAFSSYGQTYHGIFLDKQSCTSLFPHLSISLTLQTVDEHQSNIVNLVSTATVYLFPILTIPL